MSNLLHKLTPKFCVVIIVATFSPIVYITIIDQSFRLKIDNLPNEIATRKPVTAQQTTTKNVNPNVKKKMDQKDKIKTEKERKHVFKEEPQRLKKAELKLNAISKNSSRYAVKTHTNSSAVLGIKEQQFRLCTLLPKRLVGSLNISADVNKTSVQDLESLQRVAKGGHYKPKHCEPREKTAIIIPYRDREKHLEIVVHHLHNVLQRQDIEYGIYVVEMAYPSQFNKGLLSNVGFLTAASIHEFTCYVIHDVDLLPVDDRNIYRCGRVPRHLIAFSSKFNYNLPYLSYFGGAVAFTPDQFWKVNGYSNLYFGWGGEDDDIVTRIVKSGLHFSRPKKIIGGFVALHHGKDSANPLNPHRAALRATSARRKDVDGIRTVKYNRLALEFKDLYTWVFIRVKEAQIMQKYEEYLQPPV